MPDEETVKGNCPFCGATLHVSWGQEFLAHQMPWCEKFKKLTADEFVQAVLDGQHKN